MKQIIIEILTVVWVTPTSLGSCKIVVHHSSEFHEGISSLSSIAVSIFALGGMIGGLFGGFITDRFGR